MSVQTLITEAPRDYRERVPPSIPERRLRLAAAMSIIAEADEILTRTSAIVDRLCPAPPAIQVSSRYPELNTSWSDAHYAAARRRRMLFAAIKPRIAAKVKGRGK
jgi:hypothetical protein